MGDSSIFEVVRSGEMNKLQELVGKGGSTALSSSCLFAGDRDGQTALHIAAGRGLIKEAGYLIECGSFVHVYDTAGRVPFHVAVKNNEQEMARYLLEMGTFPHINTRNEDTALHLSAERGHVEMSNWLISTGANLNYKNRDGDTPLHKAAVIGCVPLLKKMLEFGADVESVNTAGSTPFHKAVAYDELSAVQFFYDKGANIDHMNYQGDSALHVAAASGSSNVIKWLLLQGAVISVENVLGQTPVDVARTDRIKRVLQEVAEGGLGAIYNRPKESPEEMTARQREEFNLKMQLEEETWEDTCINARCLLEKELALLAAERGGGNESSEGSNNKKIKIKTKRKTKSSPTLVLACNGVVDPASDDEDEERGNKYDNKNGVNDSENLLENLINRAKRDRPTLAALHGMVPAPVSCASGVTDNAGTTIAGHRSDDTLSEYSLNDSMISQNSTEFWNERAIMYLHRMKNFVKRIEEYSSSEEGSVVDVPTKEEVEEEEYEQHDVNDDDGGDLPTEEQDSSSSDDESRVNGEDNEENMEVKSLERMIELQEGEMSGLLKQQQHMLQELQQAQQDEVEQELLSMSLTMDSEYDDTLPVWKVKDVKKNLDEKHSAQLSQLWLDHTSTVEAMNETHKLERMAFSMETDGSYEEGDEDDQQLDEEMTEKEQIAILESDIVALRRLLRDSGVSPSGLLTSPSGITSVKEEAVEHEEVASENLPLEEDETEGDMENAVIEQIEYGADERVSDRNQDLEETVNNQEVSDDVSATKDITDLIESVEKVDVRSDPRGSNQRKKVAKPKAKNGIKLLASGNLAAGLGMTAIQSLLSFNDDVSSSEEESISSSVSSEYDLITDDEQLEDDVDNDEDLQVSMEEVLLEEAVDEKLESGKHQGEMQTLVAVSVSHDDKKHSLAEDLDMEVVGNDVSDTGSLRLSDKSSQSIAPMLMSSQKQEDSVSKTDKSQSSTRQNQDDERAKTNLSQPTTPKTTAPKMMSSQKQDDTVSKITKSSGANNEPSTQNTKSPTMMSSRREDDDVAKTTRSPAAKTNNSEPPSQNTAATKIMTSPQENVGAKTSNRQSTTPKVMAAQDRCGAVAKRNSTQSDTQQEQGDEGANTNTTPKMMSAQKQDDVNEKTPAKFVVTSPLTTSSRKKATPGKLNQRLIASGELAAGLGGMCMLSFMQASDDDMSSTTSSLTAISRLSRGASVTQQSLQVENDTRSIMDEHEDNNEDAAGVDDNNVEDATEDDYVNNSPTENDNIPSDYRLRTSYTLSSNPNEDDVDSSDTPSSTRSENDTYEDNLDTTPFENEHVPPDYTVRTIYNLTPPSRQRQSLGDDGAEVTENEEISMLKANILALQQMLEEPGALVTTTESSSDVIVQEDNNDDVDDVKLVEEESKKVFQLIDTNGDGVVSKIELIKGLRSNSLNLPDRIRQEDGSRDDFMAVFHSIDTDNSSDISLPEFISFCQKVHGDSSAHIMPTICNSDKDEDVENKMIEEGNVTSSQDDEVNNQRLAAGQAINATVDMLKRAMEDGDLNPTPDQSLKFNSKRDSNDTEPLSSKITPKVLAPVSSTVTPQYDLSKFYALAKKLRLLASCMLSDSRASDLRDIAIKIEGMISDIETEEGDDDEWSTAASTVAQSTHACRQWKVDALACVRAEIQELEERVSHIYTVFLE